MTHDQPTPRRDETTQPSWFATYPASLEPTYTSRVRDGVELFALAVNQRPHDPAIHFFDTTITFAEADVMAQSLAAELKARSVVSGDRVGLFMQNDPQFVIALHAVWLVGGVAVTLNPMLKARELHEQLADSGVSVLICLDGLGATVAEAKDGTDVRVVLATSERAFAPGEKSVEDTEPFELADARLETIFAERRGQTVDPVGIDPEDVALFCYTSGTTGPPKAAMLTHQNIAYGEVYCRVAGVGADDVVVGGAPLFHVTGITGHIAVARLATAPLILFHRFDASVYLRMVKRWRGTFSILALTAYVAILNSEDFDRQSVESLSKVFTGGAPVSPAVVERFEAATGQYMHNTYGMTETSSPTHMVPLGMRAPIDPSTGAISVGLPVPNLTAEIRDAVTDAKLPVGESGQIVSRGPGVVPGYWNRPEESERALVDSFMHTGDVGVMNEDGWFFLIDRMKDMIVASGYKVWPREVEDVLYEHPAVREAAVVGEPDEYRGETVVAYVSLRAGFSEVTEQELIGHCKERLSAYKYPRRLTIIDDVPKTATGKFMRRALRSQVG